MRYSLRGLVALALVTTVLQAQQPTAQKARHNVILFVADGLRHNSVTAEDMPTFWRLRHEGVDFRNSHSVFPTFTTANASAIATGHGLGDTGDFSNTFYAGMWLTKPEANATAGKVVPDFESDPVLANINAVFHGNYLGETTFLTAARAAGYNVAALGKLGPTAIQQVEAVSWGSSGSLSLGDAIVVDDTTGNPEGLPLPKGLREAMVKAELPLDAPNRTNGFDPASQWNAIFKGDAQTPGTLDSNHVQEQWFADVATKVLLPQFTASGKPFVLLFWSRDPDGAQHYNGDSLQQLKPGINGPTSKRGLRNADHCLKQLLDWLDAHPEIKANTDVVVTSDHGFATISRREVSAHATTKATSAQAIYALNGKEKAQPAGTLPTGFLGIDLSLREHLRLFDPAVRTGDSGAPFAEVQVSGAKPHSPTTSSSLLCDHVTRLDGSDARLIVAANGGSDLIYVPSGDAAIVHETVSILATLDYVGSIFVDDRFCPTQTACPGALRLSDIGLVGSSKVMRPAIAVSYKTFRQTPGDLQSTVQIANTDLQEGQGNHGALDRALTFNTMIAVGPDFKRGFVDQAPVGNTDIAPTLAHVLGIPMASVGMLKGRVAAEALVDGKAATAMPVKTALSAPTTDGTRTLLEYEEFNGTRYLNRACLVHTADERCPE